MPPGRKPGAGFPVKDSAALAAWARLSHQARRENGHEPTRQQMAALGKRGRAAQLARRERA